MILTNFLRHCSFFRLCQFHSGYVRGTNQLCLLLSKLHLHYKVKVKTEAGDINFEIFQAKSQIRTCSRILVYKVYQNKTASVLSHIEKPNKNHLFKNFQDLVLQKSHFQLFFMGLIIEVGVSEVVVKALQACKNQMLDFALY